MRTFERMDTLAVKVLDKRALAILNELESLGVIAMRPSGGRKLSDIVASIRAQVKRPMTQQEVMEEVGAHRRSKRRHAKAKKDQDRR